ncbi:hypothetical protein SORBI_3004G245700 [Sorghum bicolor]|nr:hypothetical protein SORBI_3004G245700 [Sorghum bicolor]
MAAVRRFVVPVLMVFLVFSAAAAATVSAARPLAGDDEPSAGAIAGEPFVSRFLRQRLRGPSHSCQTWNPNGGC